MIRLKHCLLASAALLLILPAVARLTALSMVAHSTSDDGVHALFNLDHPDTGPFPSDVFTVEDATHNTGRRVNLPYPDCLVRVSDCEDLDVINTLDGFGLQTRLSIPFDGPIDVTTATSATVFLISLGNTLHRGDDERARVIGINQIVWDTFTNTLHVESDELLTQHTRYALIVTNDLRDVRGRPVEATKAFRRFRQTVRGDYKQALLEAIHAARRVGVREHDIAVASVYTTQSITSVMERIRDQIKADTPASANFLLGPNGERAVFNLADVTSIAWHQHTRVNPPGFAPPAPIDLAILRYIPNAVGTIAYGVYTSPEYRVPGEYIPAVGTLTETPPAQGHNTLSFTLFLPSGPRPEGGWPVAIVGTAGDQHFATGALAAMLAAHGVATLGINVVGNGFGPLGTLAITLADGRSLVIPDAGRGIDQNGDNLIGFSEGSSAAPPWLWTIGVRDANRQNAIDLLQLVRVIEVGMDVDGDRRADLDPNRIFYYGNSAGSMYGAIFLALEPNVSVAVEGVPGGLSPEHGRWAPARRANFFGPQFRDRIPSLLNAPGITMIDGVAINPPHFNENKPLRDQPPVTNTVAGAMDIQHAMELHEWGQQSGQSPLPWVRYLREAPMPGIRPKSLLILFATGDQNAINPGTSAILRAGNLVDRTVHYRHDLAFAEDATIPKNPHFLISSPTSPNVLFRSIVQGVQRQVGAFFASDGTVVVHPEPARFFEVPFVGPLPEGLNYIR